MSALRGRRERKRQQTLDHLADTAWQLFATQGYESVTMEAIAEAADVAKGTLYKYFPVKEALLRHRFHRELLDSLPDLLKELATLPGTAERLRGFLARSADWSIRNRDYLGHYLRERDGCPLRPRCPHPQRYRADLQRLCLRGSAAGRIPHRHRYAGRHPLSGVPLSRRPDALAQQRRDRSPPGVRQHTRTLPARNAAVTLRDWPAIEQAGRRSVAATLAQVERTGAALVEASDPGRSHPGCQGRQQ